MTIVMKALPCSLRQLQYAVAIADTGGFRRAAELCHVSQPSLSAQLAQLEEALGVRLFERNRRRVLLTAAGEDLVARARRVLAEADELAESARGMTDPHGGTIKIGAIPTVSPYLLPEVAPALRARFPRLTILWSEEKTEPLLHSLAAGRVDAALLTRVAAAGAFVTEPVGEDPFVLAGPSGHPLLRRRSAARPAELEGQSVLLLDDGHCFRDQALALCARAHAHEGDFRATSLTTLAQMVAGGAGVTLLPELSLRVENRHGELAIRRFAAPVPHRTLVLAWRPRTPRAAMLREVALGLRLAARTAGAVGGRRPKPGAPPRSTARV